MIQKNISAADEDDGDNLPVVPASPTFTASATPSSTGGISICDLFNFSNQQWINLYLCRSKEAVQEEMLLYEMLEKENVGDEAGLVDMDETNEDLLAN
jgi:hypothetical protein